jgi:type II secretory pathway component PulF
MATFNFKAVNQTNSRQETGTVDAVDEARAIDTLTARGLQIISLKEVSLRAGFSILNFISRVNTKDLVAFSRQFSLENAYP